MIQKFITTHFRKLIQFLAIIIYIITAYNSHGYYHADEHYQIIEFAGIKLGTHSPYELAWEYNAQLRSAIQPTICYGIINSLNLIKIQDPYFQVFILRLITALFALFCINYFVKQTENTFKKEFTKKAYYVLSYLLWFIPFISVRFSSETLSGLLFLLGIAEYLNTKEYKCKAYLVGLLFGLSFLFRFQSALLILGFSLWLLLYKRQFNYMLKIGISLIFVFLVGILIDSWFYNQLTITSYNYLNASIIQDDGSGFGASPWHYYIENTIHYQTFIIGIPIITALLFILIKNPLNIIIWSIMPFIIAHSIIPHKEERFLFPIVYFFPIILTIGYEKLNQIIKSNILIRIFNYTIIVVFAIVNSIGIIAMCQKSAGIGRMEITKYIHDNYTNKHINLVYSSFSNPYNPWQSLHTKFYVEKNITEKHIENLKEVDSSLCIKNAENLLIIRKGELNDYENQKIIADNHFILKIQSIPKWQEYINKFYKGFDNDNILMLYRLEK